MHRIETTRYTNPTTSRAVRKKLFLSMSCLVPFNPDFTIALDKMMRRDLDAWSSFWFWILVASTIMVAIGIICEAPELLQTVGLGRKTVERIRKFWYIRLRRIDLNGWERLCPELITKNGHNRKWIAKIGFIGWAFVALGVAGEGVAEYFVSDAETNIRAFDEASLIEAQHQAGNAATSAKTAHEELDAVKNETADVMGQAKQLRQLQGEAVEAQSKFNIAAMHFTFGRIPDEYPLQTLKTLPKYSIEILFKDQDGEAYTFAGLLRNALKEIGWNVADLVPTREYPPFASHGVPLIGSILVVRTSPEHLGGALLEGCSSKKSVYALLGCVADASVVSVNPTLPVDFQLVIGERTKWHEVVFENVPKTIRPVK
jgi:hypothetical protein